MRTTAAPETTELTSLSYRLGLLLVVRLFMVGVVLLSSFALPNLTLDPTAKLAAQCYVGVTVLLELAHRLLTRHTTRRWLLIVNAMLLVDGVFVAAVLAGSGQSRSIFIFLAYVHIVSVTLLVGFRTGLKIALWHSILLLTVYYLGLAGWLPSLGLASESVGHQLSKQLEVAQATALWLVAIVTAAFSSINERELRRRKGELSIIADLSTAIEETRRPSEILQTLVGVTTTKLHCLRAVAVCPHGGSTMIVGAGPDIPAVQGETLEAFGGVIAEAARTQTSVLVRALDPTNDRLLDTCMPEATNVAIVPLVAESETLAVLVAEWGASNKRRVTRPMIDLLSNVAGRVALSLSNTFLLAEVQRLAYVDGLTGLPNRRTFNQSIEREISRARRSGNPVSLLMLDIDHFKAINDTFGHQMGDQVLAESASGVMNACRGEDLPARYGGEEIVVVMPNCSAQQAPAAAERIRRALAEGNVTLQNVSASGGVATFPDNAEDVAGLVAAADEALYRSKSQGRNRTTASDRVMSRDVDTPVG